MGQDANDYDILFGMEGGSRLTFQYGDIQT